MVTVLVLFSISSSSLLLLNKMCLYRIPTPSLLSTLQFACATLSCIALQAGRCIPEDRYEWSKVRPYLAYVAMFVATIYCNMRALQHSNVETLIVFRACCPLIVCWLDWLFLDRTLPSPRSWAALLLIVLGAGAYVVCDRAFELHGWSAYSWCTAYLLIISVEMVLGKHLVGPHLKFASMWGPTLYANSLSIAPMLSIGLLTHEPDRLAAAAWSSSSLALLSASCVVGVAISYLGWRSRSLLTATSYTVFGVANKMLTLLANALLWDKHASTAGIAALCVCLGGASLYQQSPLRSASLEANGTPPPTPRAKLLAADCRSTAKATSRRKWALPVALILFAGGGTFAYFWSASPHLAHLSRDDEPTPLPRPLPLPLFRSVERAAAG